MTNATATAAPITVNADIVRALHKFTSKEESRPNLHPIRFERLGNDYRAVATDGAKLLAAYGFMGVDSTWFPRSVSIVFGKAIPKSVQLVSVDAPTPDSFDARGRYETVAQLLDRHNRLAGAVPVTFLDDKAFPFPNWLNIVPRELTPRPLQTEEQSPNVATIPSAFDPRLVGAFALDHLPYAAVRVSGVGVNPEGRPVIVEIDGDPHRRWAGLFMPRRDETRLEAVPEWLTLPVPALTLADAPAVAA